MPQRSASQTTSKPSPIPTVDRTKRILLLTDIAVEVAEWLLERQHEERADPKEIFLEREKIALIVDRYIQKVVDFKRARRIMQRIDNDKIAIFLAVECIRVSPFVSLTEKTSTIVAEMANEFFGVRVCTTILGMRNFPAGHFADLVFALRKAVDHDDYIESWGFLAMKGLRDAYGSEDPALRD